MINEIQKRIILDTSVYGRLIEDFYLVDKLVKLIPKKYVVYGNKTIRNELRDTPKHTRLREHSKRMLLLNIYDSFVRKYHHDLKYNKLIETLAKDYLKEYKKQKGSLSDKAMKNDLIIIATATIYQLDIVVSDDERSMFSKAAIQAYGIVNRRYGIKNPVFKKYNDFKKEVTRRLSHYDV